VTAVSAGASAVPEAPAVRYVGFWARCLASLIDTILLSLVLAPLGRLFHVDTDGAPSFDLRLDFTRLLEPTHALASFTLNLLLPAVAAIAFWLARGATPGKMVIGAVIVDAQTLGPPSQKQALARYLGYYVSALALLIGFFWIAFDPRKQGWHDKIAGTLVIRRRR